MANIVVMPKPDVMTDVVVFVKWLKEENDTVDEGEALFEVESEKSSFEIESPSGGVLLKRIAEPDTEYQIGAPLGVIGEKDEVYDLEKLIKE